jgi:predicted anti-sigma-YlaC factor YlaD
LQFHGSILTPDDERLSLETCRGGKINTLKKERSASSCLKIHKGIFNFTCCQKVSIGTLFCQGVNTKTFSFTKKALCTGYKTYMAIS